MLSDTGSLYSRATLVVVEAEDSFGSFGSGPTTPTHDPDLQLYRTCAREFFDTGRVVSGRGAFDKPRFSVHVTLLLVALVFCASTATGVTPLAILSLQLSAEIDAIAMRLAQQVTNVVTIQLRELTQPAPVICEAVSRLFQVGLLSSHLEGGLESVEVQRLITFLYGAITFSDNFNIPYLLFGTERAAFLMYQQQADRLTLWNRTAPCMMAATPADPAPTNYTCGLPDATAWPSPGPAQIDTSGGPVGHFDAYDPRRRPWYTPATAALPADYAGWTAPYIYFDGTTLGVTAIRSLRNRTGHFIGVVGADITLQGVVDYLNSDAMRLSPNMRHTVVDKSGLIIGSSVPGVVTARRSAAGDEVRLSVLDEQQPGELRAVVQGLQRGADLTSVDTQGGLVTIDGKYVFATTMRDEYNLNWVYIMYVPRNDFLGRAIATTSVCIAACLGVMVGTLLLALFAAWDLSSRLRLLATDMRRATSLALDDIRTQQNGSRVREIQAISIEFCKLVNMLRSFQKYLPQAQVGFLLSSNLEANLAAIQQQITVLFLHVANFTAIVEALDEAEVIRFYGDTMTLLTRKVLQADGTLDKYIGDAIMAFWNMPRRVARHEQRAVEAALACRDALPRLQQKGWEVEFRIGINTGHCQVGNFGSRDRLNYTAIGDNVNVASRLEALCKAYHARLLISSTTHAGLDHSLFLTRLVDKVAVKGKDGATVIHEVLGWRQDAADDVLQNCRDYEEAHSLYTAGSYHLAQEAWRRAAARGDRTAQMMADRLRHGTPEAGGVWRWTTK